MVTPDDQFDNTPLHSTDLNNTQNVRLSEWQTTSMAFILCPHALITIRDERNHSLNGFLERLHHALDKTDKTLGKNVRIPQSPLDLCLRLLNIVIDRYLEIRLPLTRRINYWQNALLHSSKRFRQWQNLLQEHMALQYIDYLCEEHHDVLQELYDNVIENQSILNLDHSLERQDIILVRINDLLNHVERVQHHVNRLQAMIKTAIDLHFSAMANQTNENMRILAIITAVFSPLTLLTGIYGMNFEWMPGLKNHNGFWIMVVMMMSVTALLLYLFRQQRLVGTSQTSIVELLSEHNDKS